MRNIQAFSDKFNQLNGESSWKFDAVSIVMEEDMPPGFAEKLIDLCTKDHSIRIPMKKLRALMETRRLKRWTDDARNEPIAFTVNEHGWSLLSPALQKAESYIQTIFGIRVFNGEDFHVATVYKMNGDGDIMPESCLIDVYSGEVIWESESPNSEGVTKVVLPEFKEFVSKALVVSDMKLKREIQLDKMSRA